MIKIQENLIPQLFPFSVCGCQTARIKNKEKKSYKYCHLVAFKGTKKGTNAACDNVLSPLNREACVALTLKGLHSKPAEKMLRGIKP